VAEKTTDLTKFIEEAFGSNATYVEGLLKRYKSDPKLVDESWQAYFSELLNGGAPSVDAKAETRPVGSVPALETKAAGATQKPQVPLPPDTEPKPLTGPAKKIVENMELSLTVPTATSFRDIPVKVLEENRRVMNEHLASHGRGKASFTHIIAWAIVQAVKVYPHLNFGYAEVDGTPSRLRFDQFDAVVFEQRLDVVADVAKRLAKFLGELVRARDPLAEGREDADAQRVRERLRELLGDALW